MSQSDAMINLLVALIVLTPFMLLAGWVIRRTPLTGLEGAPKWRAYRIRLSASIMIFGSLMLIVWFLFNLIAG